jgi:hypothetical protein
MLMTVQAFAHKSYVSIADMEYNEKLDQIEVSLKLTAHDFEYILEKKYNKRIHIENVPDSSEIGMHIQYYLKKHFTIVSQKQNTIFNYVGKEVNVRDELYFYFTFKNILNPLNIIVSNSFLFELFLKQQNIIHYKIKNKTKSVTLVPSIKEGRLSYND